jgi:hypothetical protein
VAQRPGIGASHRAIMLIGQWPVGRTPRELRTLVGVHDTLLGTHTLPLIVGGGEIVPEARLGSGARPDFIVRGRAPPTSSLK